MTQAVPSCRVSALGILREAAIQRNTPHHLYLRREIVPDKSQWWFVRHVPSSALACSVHSLLAATLAVWEIPARKLYSPT